MLCTRGTTDSRVDDQIEDGELDTGLLKQIGFSRGRASPCNFYNIDRNLSLTVHGGDCFITGSLKNIEWLGERFRQRCKIKFNKLGPEPGSNLEISILNRVI